MRLLLAGFIVLLAADLTQAMRPSGLSAVGCVPALFRSEPEIPGFAIPLREVIATEAARYDLPAELVAAVIVNHQAKISSRDRFTDCVGSALGADVSVGLAQVRLSTAARLDGQELEALTASQYRSLRSQLLDSEQNIAYQARELRALLEQEHRYSGIRAEELVHEPAVMVLLVTEYRMGRLGTPNDSSRLSGAAFDALRWIERGTVDFFGRDSVQALGIRSEVREYLRYIYCDSGIFNAGACESWNRSLRADLQAG